MTVPKSAKSRSPPSVGREWAYTRSVSAGPRGPVGPQPTGRSSPTAVRAWRRCSELCGVSAGAHTAWAGRRTRSHDLRTLRSSKGVPVSERNTHAGILGQPRLKLSLRRQARRSKSTEARLGAIGTVRARCSLASIPAAEYVHLPEVRPSRVSRLRALHFRTLGPPIPRPRPPKGCLTLSSPGYHYQPGVEGSY